MTVFRQENLEEHYETGEDLGRWVQGGGGGDRSSHCAVVASLGAAEAGPAVVLGRGGQRADPFLRPPSQTLSVRPAGVRRPPRFYRRGLQHFETAQGRISVWR